VRARVAILVDLAMDINAVECTELGYTWSPFTRKWRQGLPLINGTKVPFRNWT